ncbi:hypothetical protein AN958_11813 [Leucoagaricus sp. SymC.cos]|nr:hypothetical protein AN958_11813 [Leucoagaricus sp. SymC.cos]
MPAFRVFLGAPPLKDINNDATGYHWQDISPQSQSYVLREQLLTPADFPATEALDDASRRVSLIYQNVIFNDDIEEDETQEDMEDGRLILSGPDQTTAITWPPTQQEPTQQRNRSRGSLAQLSFLNTTTRSSIESPLETQPPTQESQSINYTDASSIARFPTFHFNLHSLLSISQLVKQKVAGTVKISTLLLAVLEVEGPDLVTLKRGKDAGKEVAILKMILGDEGGSIVKLTAWRVVAERWGGLQPNTVAVKTGDIVLIENVTATFDVKSSPSITASPFLKSALTICYRTMPYAKSDSRLRPDLRLGRSDAAVRKVAAVVAWFQQTVGL